MMTMIRMRNGVGYWGFSGHARHKSVASLAYFDWTLIHMSQRVMVSWEEDKDKEDKDEEGIGDFRKLKDNLRHSKLICADVGGGEDENKRGRR